MESIQYLIDLFIQFMDVILHLDVHLNEWVTAFGPWIYVILFLIIFCETGLIILPFLPGDSLLFALGALTATENAFLSLPILAVSLIIAGILGDAVNYSIGRFSGPKIFSRADSFWLNKKHLAKTQAFYDKHGGKTIILARFMPIVRTFAPFVAGMGQMEYRKFAAYNVIGAVVWVLSFLFAGSFFGNLPAVKQNFHVVIFAIIIISFMPVAIEIVKAYFEKKRSLQASKSST